MKALLAKTLFTCFVLLTTASNVNAEEVSKDDDPSNAEEYVIIDSSPLSPGKRLLMEKNRLAEMEQSEEMLEEESTQLGGLIIPINTQNLTMLTSNQLNSTAASYSSDRYHWIDKFHQDNILEIEDGTQWIFDRNDRDIISSWKPGDTIEIAPKGFSIFGSNCAYVLINKDDLDTSIDVNLFRAPIAFGTLTTWATGIDNSMGHLYIKNGNEDRSVWEISSTDMYLFEDWEVDHTIIVGENNSWIWWFSPYDHILINVDKNHYIRARKVSSTSNLRSAEEDESEAIENSDLEFSLQE